MKVNGRMMRRMEKVNLLSKVIGVLTYSNGDQYVGGFSSNKKSGKGVLNMSDGKKYDGDWNEDMRSGIGNRLRKNL
jgi:hypothetical protein